MVSFSRSLIDRVKENLAVRPLILDSNDHDGNFRSGIYAKIVSVFSGRGVANFESADTTELIRDLQRSVVRSENDGAWSKALADYQSLAACSDADLKTFKCPEDVMFAAIRSGLRLRSVWVAKAILDAARSAYPESEDRWQPLLKEFRVLRRSLKECRQCAEQVKEAIRRGDWPVAVKLARSAGNIANPSWRAISRIRLTVQDYLGVLAAEAKLVEEIGLSSNRDLDFDAAYPGLTARLNLQLFEQVLDDLDAIQIASLDQNKADNLKAMALTQRGDTEQALDLERCLWDRGAHHLFSRISGKLQSLRNWEEYAQFLASAEESGAASVNRQIVPARITLLQSQRKRREALEAAQILDNQDDYYIYVKLAAPMAEGIGDFSTLTKIIRQLESRSPPYDQQYYAAVAIAVKSFFNYTRDIGKTETLRHRLNAGPSSPEILRHQISTALHFGDLEFARQKAELALTLFEAKIEFWVSYLKILAEQNDEAALCSVKSRIFQKLPTESACVAVMQAGWNAWGAKELPDLIAYAAKLPPGSRQAEFFHSIYRSQLKPSDLTDVLARVKVSPATAQGIWLEIVKLKAADRWRLLNTVVTPQPMDSFRRARDEGVDRIEEKVREFIGSERVEQTDISGADWLRACVENLAIAKAASGRHLTHTAESFFEANELMDLLLDRIRRCEPTSVIRLGDGEGHFLPREDSTEKYTAGDREYIWHGWWGEIEVSEDRQSELTVAFETAVANADIVGVVPLWRLMHRVLSRRAKSMDSRGLQTVLHAAAHSLRGVNVLTSAHLHQDLHTWSLWAEFFTEVRSVSWISCNDLDLYLAENHGVRSRLKLKIPAQSLHIGKLNAGRFEKAPAESLIDRHDEICAAIKPERGEVWLVAAGFLGKIYCDLIRARGGIAIDVGSIADYWVGHRTRTYVDDEQLDFALECCLLPDRRKKRSAGKAAIVGRLDVAKSSNDGRYNIASKHDLDRDTSTPARAKLRVVGNPRCGSGYLAKLLRASGFEVGHERMMEDGIVSWLCVVDDLNPPRWTESIRNAEFDHTILYVRDPYNAVPSIILENGMGRSFNFRRQHILRAKNIDIADFDTSIARAVASMLCWTDMAMDLDPDAVVQVEDGDAQVGRFIASMPDLGGRSRRSNPGELPKDINATSQQVRFCVTKPNLSTRDWHSLDRQLFDQLSEFCEQFGYERPWERPAIVTGHQSS